MKIKDEPEYTIRSMNFYALKFHLLSCILGYYLILLTFITMLKSFLSIDYGGGGILIN